MWCLIFVRSCWSILFRKGTFKEVLHAVLAHFLGGDGRGGSVRGLSDDGLGLSEGVSYEFPEAVDHWSSPAR